MYIYIYIYNSVAHSTVTRNSCEAKRVNPKRVRDSICKHMIYIYM